MLVTERFELNPLFKRLLRRRQPEFGFGGLGAIIFYRTYSRQIVDANGRPTGDQETWADTIIRAMEGFGSIRKWWLVSNGLSWDEDYWQDYIQRMTLAAFDMRWLPPGRGLQVGGTDFVYRTGAMAHQNPLSGDTRVVTREYGIVPIETLKGRDVHFLTHNGWKIGTVNCYGTQKVQEIVFAPVQKMPNNGWREVAGRERVRVVATPDHSWPIIEGGIPFKINTLKVGDVVAARPATSTDYTFSVPEYDAGFRHGLFFADGNEGLGQDTTDTRWYQLRLCGGKAKYLPWFEHEPYEVGYPTSYDGDPLVTVCSAVRLKDLPPSNMPASYLAGFIQGWIAGDGFRSNKTVRVFSQDAAALTWLKEHAAVAGYLVLGHRIETSTETNYGPRSAPLGVVTLTDASDEAGWSTTTAWKVVSITPIQTAIPVYCATVPEAGFFALANGIYTGNCGATSITKLSRDAGWTMNALMHGVGVGFDVDRYSDRLTLPAEETETFVIPDTREGWVESVVRLIESYERGSRTVVFDYSQIRPAGTPIKGFGGVASGPEPLRALHEALRPVLGAYARGEITAVRLVADVINLIGTCVVAGGVRRTAEIALGSPHDREFLNLKDFSQYDAAGNVTYHGTMDERAGWGWTSNNSAVLKTHEDFTTLPALAERIVVNGEPGVINLINIQQYGRYGELRRDDAFLINPCVTGDTPILTKEGYKRIEELVGSTVEVWNGIEWSQVQPRITGKHQPILRVTFDDGTSLDCTPYHGFHIAVGDHTPTVVQAKDLKPGEKLWKYEMPVVELPVEVSPSFAYTQGVFAGGGHIDDRDRYWVSLYGEKSALLAGMDHLAVYEDPERDRLLVQLPEQHSKPLVLHRLGVQSRLAWFAGLTDIDGTLTKDGSLQITSTDQEFLLQTRLMLTTLGVQAKVTKGRDAAVRELPDGNGGLKPHSCQTDYRLLLCAADVVRLRELGLGQYLRRVDVSGVNPNRDARHFVKVVSVEPIGVAETVYCFNEPKNHTGTFNGIVTAQCGEQPLEDKEVCCLADVFWNRCKTREEFFEAIEFATTYASTITLLPTYEPQTNIVIAKNRRIGVSISGLAERLAFSHVSSVITDLRMGYKIAREVNARLAREARVPESVRVTTIKPNGSTSQLTGASPGIHLPPYGRYRRRMRVQEQSPIVPVLLAANLPVEYDKKSANTLVFSYPIDLGKVRGQRDVTMWQKGMMALMMQRHWSDNSVSVTITFDRKSEGPFVEDFLAYMVPGAKALSMYPEDEVPPYEQLPYEPITAKEYQEMKAQIRPIDWSTFGGSDGEMELYCTTDSCVI